jgi:hypothetical protein
MDLRDTILLIARIVVPQWSLASQRGGTVATSVDR